MTTPPPDALEQIKRLEELRAAAEAKPLGPYRRLALAKYWSASNEVIDWLLPLARAQLETQAGLIGRRYWPHWKTMDSAPTDGREVWVMAAPYDDLQGFITKAAYHPDAGWCVDELREPILWTDSLHTPPQKDEGDD